MTNRRNIQDFAIIMLFAALHFVTAIISRAFDYYDDIPLTLLTITMVIVISMRNNARVELMAILTLATTLIGFVIGTWLREPMTTLVNSNTFAPAISTFLITLILGLVTQYVTRRTVRFRNREHNFPISTQSIIIIALSILVLRMVYVAMDRAQVFTQGMLFDSIINLFGNSWALLFLLASNIVLSIHLTRNEEKGRHRRYRNITILSISTLIIPTLSATLIFFDIPFLNSPFSTISEFLQILSGTVIINLITITICILIRLSITSRNQLLQERELKHRSQYQYERLKQQINPHFLFNSLGILDYLVQEEQTERASAFIHKLAGMYRYLLSNDDKALVKLTEELDFTTKYIDLLAERFPEGMVFEIDVDEVMRDRYVVPCALQLLVENATKHNIVSSDMPLHISIRSHEEQIVVRNNLQMRVHGQPSTHLGLENIRRQYLDITGKDICVEKSETEFIVKLPII